MSKEGKSLDPLSDIWPQERDFMARPDRYKYVRKIVKPDGCVFCQSRDKGPSLESLCVFRNSDSMVVLNKYPYNSGHLLVLPSRHCGDLTELSSAEYHAVSETLLKVVKVVKEVYECAGLNIGLNHGKVAGAGIPEHLHWHVIPRWNGDTNFFPLVAETKVVPETLEQTYSKIQPHFI